MIVVVVVDCCYCYWLPTCLHDDCVHDDDDVVVVVVDGVDGVDDDDERIDH